jgi:hypothetical protein
MTCETIYAINLWSVSKYHSRSQLQFSKPYQTIQLNQLMFVFIFSSYHICNTTGDQRQYCLSTRASEIRYVVFFITTLFLHIFYNYKYYVRNTYNIKKSTIQLVSQPLNWSYGEPNLLQIDAWYDYFQIQTFTKS